MKKLYLIFALFLFSLNTSFAEDDWIVLRKTEDGRAAYMKEAKNYFNGKLLEVRFVNRKGDFTLIHYFDCKNSRYMTLGEPKWEYAGGGTATFPKEMVETICSE